MERISAQDLPAGLMETMLNVEAYLAKCGLDKTLLGLLKTRVSQINGCAYCLDMHFKEAVHAGEDPIRLISLPAWRETPYYSPQEQAVLAFSERLTEKPGNERSDDLHDELLNFFSKSEIACLTLAVAQINSWNRITRSFGTMPGNYRVKETG